MTPPLAVTHAAAHAVTVIHTPQIRYLSILPVLVLLGGAVLLLAVASLVRKPLRMTFSTVGTVAISLGALGCALWQWYDVMAHGPYTAIDHAVVVDGFAALVAILVPCAMVLTALVGDGYLRREGVVGPEFHVLALVSASGAVLMAEANDLILIFLGLEILSIALYVLAAFNHRRAASGEAALKYFVLGAFSSAIFVYGIALTYGATGSSNLAQIAGFLSHNVVVEDGLLLAGLSLLLVGFCFKVAAVPFHMWTPDVYQGAPSPVTGFMAAVAKIGGFAALLRVFISSFGVLEADWRPIVYVIAVVTLVLGAVMAVVQRDAKRMLAYSSINHAGFVLLGLQAATARGVSAALYYLFTYTFMVIGSFAVVTLLGRRGDTAHDIAGYRGLAQRQPLLALSLAVLLLAQAGVPFTTGFLAKLQVVLAAVDANSTPLAVLAMVTAAVAAFFYLRLGVLMYTPLRTGASGGPEDLRPDDAVAFGVPWRADAVDVDAVGTGAGNGTAAGNGNGNGTHDLASPSPTGEAAPGAPAAGHGSGDGGLVPTGDRSVTVLRRMNAALLLDAEPVTGDAEIPAGAVYVSPDQDELAETEAGVHDKVPVPPAAGVAIGLCVGVTVVFGIYPAPLIDLAHAATLLFVS